MSEGEFTDGGIEWRPEYRDDDFTEVGYCPDCKRPLKDISIGGRGFCEEHGWQFAEWTRPRDEDDEEEEGAEA